MQAPAPKGESETESWPVGVHLEIEEILQLLEFRFGSRNLKAKQKERRNNHSISFL